MSHLSSASCPQAAKTYTQALPRTHVDHFDVRIIREMGIRPYLTRPKDPDALKSSHLARRLGCSVNTIKTRVARMEADGVIAGYQVIPNLRHLGLTGVAYYFTAPADEEKEAAMAAIAKMDGLLEIHDFLGRGFCIDFTHADGPGLERSLGILSDITGEASPVKFYERDMPETKRALTNLDWRILQALRFKAKRSLDEVGAELGVTGRTVRTRHARMAAEGSFFAVPMLDPSKAGGLFLFEILLYIEPDRFDEVTAEFHQRMDGSHVYAKAPSTPELGHWDALVFAHNTAEVEELRARAASIPGVTRAEAWLFRGLHDHGGWLDDAIAGKVRSGESGLEEATDTADGPDAT